MTRNILLVGVGGQGILLAARIVADAARLAGFDVTTNEIHGMAQRGGSVTAQIRYGPEPHSPLMVEGEADALAALEAVEALRFAPWVRPGAPAVVAATRLVPVTASAGGAVYPDDVEERLRRRFVRLRYLDCEGLSRQTFGHARAANTILLGALARELDLPEAVWPDAIARAVRADTRAWNLRAFQLGQDAAARPGSVRTYV